MKEEEEEEEEGVEEDGEIFKKTCAGRMTGDVHARWI
jgi:hypothetical protein